MESDEGMEFVINCFRKVLEHGDHGEESGWRDNTEHSLFYAGSLIEGIDIVNVPHYQHPFLVSQKIQLTDSIYISVDHAIIRS
jgi:hypothetical protein